MKPFVFKLETVLDLRRRKEEDASVRLSEARNNLRRAREALENLNEQQQQSWEEFRNKQMSGELLVPDYQLWHNFLFFLKKSIEKQKEVVAELTEKAVIALKEMEKAMKDRKAVEKLKEKRFEQYKLALQAEEQAMLDEIAITRYQRQEGDES